MGIAKEIFGLERIDRVYEDVNQYNFGVDDGINKTIDKIDAFDISEVAIIEILKPIYLGETNVLPKYAAAIKANANKIFVRKT